jgi:ubiquinone/menaquinone biosynthesis C-methylase UbiE
MATSDSQFDGSIPAAYERFLVPLIFEPYARDIANRVARFEPQRVLELAAGTGVVTRALSAQLDRSAHVIATDLNPAMLAHAATLLPPNASLEWRQADALALPFGRAVFDSLVCQFGAMFFPDKSQAYAEASRVLNPGGRFFFNVWDRLDANEFAAAVTGALESMFPDDPPRFMARVPHGYFDVERIRRELEGAGFSSIAIEPMEETSRAASAWDVARAYCEGTPLRSEIEARAPGGLGDATERAAQAVAERFGSGAIEARIRAFVIEAAQ